MKKTLLGLTTLLLTISNQSFAQVKDADSKIIARAVDTIPDGWTKGGSFNLNFSQVALSHWAGGGQSSLSANGLLNVFANMKKGKSAWDNSLGLAYGLLSQNNGPFQKNDDRIEFSSKYGRQFNKNPKWYYGALINFKSQFAPGYNLPDDSTVISRFMAPAYLIAAIGFDYKPNKDFSLFLSPLSSRTIFVMDDRLSSIGAFGVDTNANIRQELGGLIRAKYQKDIMENVNLMTRLDLFSNYLDNPQNIDVYWETLISMKVNKYISASLSTTLVYDDNTKIAIDNNNDGVTDKFGPRVQFKEVLAIGFAYKF